jgi:hypothetical protein
MNTDSYGFPETLIRPHLWESVSYSVQNLSDLYRTLNKH